MSQPEDNEPPPPRIMVFYAMMAGLLVAVLGALGAVALTEAFSKEQEACKKACPDSHPVLKTEDGNEVCYCLSVYEVWKKAETGIIDSK